MIPLAVGLILVVLITAGMAEIPEDLRAVAHDWAFVASVAQQCDARVDAHGAAGLRDEVCRDFQQHVTRVVTDLSAKTEAFRNAVAAVNASSSLANRVEWDLFMSGFLRSKEQVVKTMERVQRLEQQALRKTPTHQRGKRP
jgi:hypothetical protein